jgi:hypothetical protein
VACTYCTLYFAGVRDVVCMTSGCWRYSVVFSTAGNEAGHGTSLIWQSPTGSRNRTLIDVFYKEHQVPACWRAFTFCQACLVIPLITCRYCQGQMFNFEACPPPDFARLSENQSWPQHPFPHATHSSLVLYSFFALFSGPPSLSRARHIMALRAGKPTKNQLKRAKKKAQKVQVRFIKLLRPTPTYAYQVRHRANTRTSSD